MLADDRRLPVAVLSGFLGAGKTTTLNHILANWWRSIPKRDWPNDDQFERFMAQHWDQVWGDRLQELVFIGIGMDEAGNRRRLEACLLPATAFTPELWMALRDPFPSWEQQLQAAE